MIFDRCKSDTLIKKNKHYSFIRSLVQSTSSSTPFPLLINQLNQKSSSNDTTN